MWLAEPRVTRPLFPRADFLSAARKAETSQLVRFARPCRASYIYISGACTHAHQKKKTQVFSSTIKNPIATSCLCSPAKYKTLDSERLPARVLFTVVSTSKQPSSPLEELHCPYVTLRGLSALFLGASPFPHLPPGARRLPVVPKRCGCGWKTASTLSSSFALST